MSGSRLNLLFIIADDLGFSDVGCYGGEILTPHIDALARDGTRMLNYHTAAACSPTRAMVLTGTDAHIGGLGCLIEQRQNEAGAQRWRGKAGYEGYLNHDVATLAEILEDQGYSTLLSGKWHLGMRQEHGPWARGFQKSLTMLPGCCNHFGYEPGLENGYSGMALGGRPIHAVDGKKLDVKPNVTENPTGFYSSDVYGDTMVSYLASRTPDEKSRPFFGYLAFTAPHWPLQCHKETMEKYKGMYDDGPFALRKRRLESLINLGIISPDVVPHEVINWPGLPEWETFSAYEKQCSIRSMEAYAGLVEEMDKNVGKVIQHLKDSGEYDNTMIVFMSDNGAEGAAYEAMPILGDRLKESLGRYYDNSLDNIGRHNSYTWLGPLWAQASTAPSRLYKMFPSEGGILVPCVVKSPAGTSLWQPGGFNPAFTTCMDLAPTFMDLIDVSLPMNGDRVSFKGRKVHPMIGKSWKGSLQRDPQPEEYSIYPVDHPIGWELNARAALRKGDWKIVHIAKAFKGKADPSVLDDPNGWELFNLGDDPGETTDLAELHPDKLGELLKDWDDYVQEAGLVWGPNALASGKSIEEAPELHDDDWELQRTWMIAADGQRAN